MMRIAFFLASAILALTGSQVFAFTTDDRIALRIEVTRLVVMMDQSQRALIALRVVPPTREFETSERNRSSIYENLVSAVLKYNLISHEICHPPTIDATLCPGLYLPRWLSRRPGDFSDGQLRKMTDEASTRLVPLWEALCAKAKAADSQTQVCAIE